MLARVRSIFYSYPAELVAAWCGVTVGAARLYKSGRRKPSRAVLRLFTLYREERVLGVPWRGWIVRGDKLVDPEGNEFTQGQLRAYFFFMQYACELAKHNPAGRDRLMAILRQG